MKGRLPTAEIAETLIRVMNNAFQNLSPEERRILMLVSLSRAQAKLQFGQTPWLLGLTYDRPWAPEM